ncbi:unnamed protein product [Ilex paraguariensis]|uniref:Uncharacterized protein n=1 Tax=Ilex paraguariensis TaxID=185542 RepID=A0ABC8S356_9AQUA
MATAEAKANCNRSFQEDARGAPNLSRGPSSSSKSESDGSPGNAANSKDIPVQGCIRYNQNFSSPDLLPDTKWWLHRHTNLEHLKDNSHEQLNAVESELEVLSSGFVSQSLKFGGERQFITEYCPPNGSKIVAGSCDQPWNIFPTNLTIEQDSGMSELKDVIVNPQKTSTTKVMGELWDADDNLMDLDSSDCIVTKQPEKLSSDLESHWVEVQKTEPWWRTVDKDELPSLVSYKSLESIENCDLPRPQAKHLGKAPSAFTQCCVQDKVVNSSYRMAEKEISNVADSAQGTAASVSTVGTQGSVGAEGFSQHSSDRPLRFTFSNKDSFSSTKEDESETQHRHNSDLSKAELLEALCHSQTRAREAEKAAQQAYDEKEHIIKLFFRQASHLFAYKQWIHILQLETLCLHLRNNNQPISTLFPNLLPRVPRKGRQLRKGRNRAAKKRQPPRHKLNKSAVAFSVGLSLAGAGLLLGWTMGWLFPAL